MSKALIKSLPELVQAGIITKESSDNIQRYFENKPNNGFNRLLIVFAILGALLVGLGIILIIAHNWDDLSRTTKTALAFLPLAVGQGLVAYTLLKKNESTAWRESSAVFLYLSIGACISLIAQVYNISGNFPAFILTWTLLGFPLIYIVNASSASLLFIIGVNYYGCYTNYFSYGMPTNYLCWLLILGVLPHYLKLYKKAGDSNFFTFHNWVLTLTFIILLGTVGGKASDFMFIAYMSLFGIYSIIGNTSMFAEKKRINNPFLLLGSLGTVIILLILSFDDFWNSLHNHKYLTFSLRNPELVVSFLLTGVAAFLLWRSSRDKPRRQIDPYKRIFLLFFIAFIIGMSAPSTATFLINVLTFLLGLNYLRKGSRINHLGILNYGLLIITALIICRYFDTGMSFLIRGLLFIAVGAGFIIYNYRLLKKRKQSPSLN